MEVGQLVYKSMEMATASQSVMKSMNGMCKKSNCKYTSSCLKVGLPYTAYCQCFRNLYANWPSHEVVGSGSGHDTDSDDSGVDCIPNNLRGEGM